MLDHVKHFQTHILRVELKNGPGFQGAWRPEMPGKPEKIDNSQTGKTILALNGTFAKPKIGFQNQDPSLPINFLRVIE